MIRNLFLLCLLFSTSLMAQEPPFSGTIFLDPDIITPDDPTSFSALTESGKGTRTMFDRRVNGWITVEAHLFIASYDDGLSLEVQVNPEFSTSEAKAAAEQFAPVLGQLPTALRQDAQTVWIHKGTEPFGGGNNNFLIHTGQADLYIRDGILEETLVHEGSHTSLDDPHATSVGWRSAQQNDPTFISTYARDNPDREDIAESFLPYLMVRYRADRIEASVNNAIEQSIPNRLAYFDDQSFDLYPLTGPTSAITRSAPKLIVYPTLAHNRLVIELDEALDLTIFNLLGQPISRQHSSGTTEIDLSGYLPGTYLLMAQSSRDRRLVKFVKL